MEKVLIQMAEEGSVHHLYPLLTNSSVKGNAALQDLQTACKVNHSKLLEVSPPTEGSSLDWRSISRKNIWVVLRLGVPPCHTEEESSESDHVFGKLTEQEKKTIRHAAVSILCARTGECHKNFKLWILTTPQIFASLPRLALHLCSLRTEGEWCAVNCDAHYEGGSSGLLMGDLEEWESYEHMEDAVNATGALADLQEEVFNSNPEITEVIYDHSMGPGVNYIKIMRDALKFNLVVRSLDLTKSLAGDVIGYCLTSVLHSSRKLQRLVLVECSLTDVGLGQLAKAMSTNPHITELSLCRNPGIGDMGLMALAEAIRSPSSNLKRLDISRNNSLYTEEKQWTTGALNCMWDALDANPKVTEVKMSECGIQPSDAIEACRRWLCRANQLEYLNVSDNALGDVAAGLILDVTPQLRWLNISHIGLGASGFRALGISLGRKHSSKLEWLAANSNNALRQQTIEGNDLAVIGDDALLSPEMKNALLMPHDKTDEGAAVRFLLDSLSGNSTLKSVEFSKVNFGDEGTEKFIDLLLMGQCKVNSIDISFNCNIEEASSHKVKEILCGGYYDTTGPTPTVITKTAAASSARHEEESKSQFVVVGVNEVEELAPTITQLTSLSIAGNATSVGERAVLAMYKNKHLKSLDLADMALVDGMLLPFSEGAQTNQDLKLETVSLRRNFILRSGINTLAEFVTFSTTLIHLDLSDTWGSFTDEAGRANRLSKTKEDGLYYVKALLTALETQPSPTLQILNMSYNDIGNVVGKAFASAVAGNTNLKVLKLQGNPELNPLLVKGCVQAVL